MLAHLHAARRLLMGRGMPCHFLSERAFASRCPELRWCRHRSTTQIEWYESLAGKAIGVLGRDHTRQLYFWAVLVEDEGQFVLDVEESGYTFRHAASAALVDALVRAGTSVDRSERQTRPLQAVRGALVRVA